MKKVLTVSCCLLLLAVVCIPAYASPTNKKITLSCYSTGTDDFVGDATVTLCALLPSGECNSAETFDCQTVYCDSSGATAPYFSDRPL